MKKKFFFSFLKSPELSLSCDGQKHHMLEQMNQIGSH